MSWFSDSFARVPDWMIGTIRLRSTKLDQHRGGGPGGEFERDRHSQFPRGLLISAKLTACTKGINGHSEIHKG